MEVVLSTALKILEFILLIGILAFLHELGHFLMARLGKIEVEEFGFGFPPRAVKLFTLGGTLFSLNWIPFGAFVRMKGEENPEQEGWLTTSGPWARLGTLLGGPVMNLLVGVLIFTFVFMRVGAPDTTRVIIQDVSAGSPAEMAGIQTGDYVLTINSTPIQSIDQIRTLISENLEKPTEIELQRADKTLNVTVTPRSNPPANQGAVGIVMTNPLKPVSFFTAFPVGLKTAGDQIGQLLALPGNLIRGTVAPEEARVVGPVGMYTIFNEANTMDKQTNAQPNPVIPAVNVLFLTATISIALGFGNLLPLPALDGGRIIFILPEILFKKRVPARWEATIHGIGFILLIGLMVWITLQDIINPIKLP